MECCSQARCHVASSTVQSQYTHQAARASIANALHANTTTGVSRGKESLLAGMCISAGGGPWSLRNGFAVIDFAGARQSRRRETLEKWGIVVGA